MKIKPEASNVIVIETQDGRFFEVADYNNSKGLSIKEVDQYGRKIYKEDLK